MHNDDEALIGEIVPVLEIDHQYVRTLDEWNDDLVDQIRRCGRAAGRRLRYRVRTFATDPAERANRRRIVCVAVTALTASTAEDKERMQERASGCSSTSFKQVR